MSAAIRCRHLHRQRGLSLDCRGAPARGGTPPAALADRALLPHGLDPIPQRVVPAAVLRGRRPRARWARSAAFPQVAPKARIWRTFLPSVLRMSWHQLKACPRPRPTSPDSCTVLDFGYLLVWGYIADLSMVPRLRRGRLAGGALSHPFILRGQKFSRDSGGVGLYIPFRQTKRKTEGPQHFAFPEISRENRGCLVLHSGNSRVSLSLRAGLGQNLRQN